ncbi:MAG: hypothetical protein AAB553_07065 [Patescibacteria group bacterium]
METDQIKKTTSGKIRHKFLLLGVVLLLYSLVVIPILVINTQQQQDTRSRGQTIQTTLTDASTPTKTPTPTFTPTPTASATAFSVTVLLDGIGSRGDNTNPTANITSNKDPKQKTKKTTVTVYDATNTLIASGSGDVLYNATDGNFTGTVPLKKSLTNGSYLVKIQVDGYLQRLVAGIQAVKSGAATTLPVTPLVTGDINRENTLNILDYNLLLDCYSDLAVASNCPTTQKKVTTDINDDGFVNQVDYNLFLREIVTQPGA